MNFTKTLRPCAACYRKNHGTSISIVSYIKVLIQISGVQDNNYVTTSGR